MSSIKIQQMLFERVVKEFGGDNITMEDLVAKCGLNDLDLKTVKTSKTIPEEHQCCARIWDKERDDKRCSKRRVGDKWFCAGHGRPMLENAACLEFVWQKCGRIDEPVPQNYRADKKIKKERKPKNNAVVDGVQKPKKALSSYFCFMNENRQKVKDENPGDKVGDIAKKLGEMWKSMGEEEKKPYQEMASKDKERYLKEMEDFQKENKTTPPKEDKFDEIDINKDGVIDKKEWEQYQEKVVEKNEEVVEKNEEVVEKKEEVVEKNEEVVEKKEEVDDEDDEEVAVVEYKYKGDKYLLDPVSKKVYNMEQDFVGKLVGKKKIDFDAVDSDEE